MDAKDLIRDRVSLVDVVSTYVQLKPSGRHMKGLCPFHQEKTPSFYVMPERQTYTCYGCHRFGDVFTFVQEMEGLDFPGALRWLSERYHIPLPERGGKRGEGRSSTRIWQDILEATRDFYVRSLSEPSGREARAYLEQRGISAPVWERFQLGWAPGGWDALAAALREKGLPAPQAQEAGVLIPTRDGRMVDRFRERLMIPICNETGRVVAFGGRILRGSEAKYINSPESPVYHKRQHLYGLHLAREGIRRQGRVVVVEGYFDLISMVEAGVDWAVAGLGTALSEEQVRLMARLTGAVDLFYDGDRAGRDAAERGVLLCLGAGLQVRVVLPPDGEDPDSFIRARGLAGWESLQAQARQGFDFVLDQRCADWDRSRPETHRLAVNRVRDALGEIQDPLIRSGYADRAGQYLGVMPEEFGVARTAPARVSPAEPVARLQIWPSEEQLLRLLFHHPALIHPLRPLLVERLLRCLPGHRLFRHFLLAVDEGGHLDFDRFRESLPPAEQCLAGQLMGSADPLEEVEADQLIEGSFEAFNRQILQMEKARLTREIRQAERLGQDARVEELTREKMRLIKDSTPGCQEAL